MYVPVCVKRVFSIYLPKFYSYNALGWTNLGDCVSVHSYTIIPIDIFLHSYAMFMLFLASQTRQKNFW